MLAVHANTPKQFSLGPAPGIESFGQVWSICKQTKQSLMMRTGGQTRVHTLKLCLRVPKSNTAFERWKLKWPLDGIRLSHLLPSFPAVGKPLTKSFQRKYLGGDFVGFIPVPAQRDESRHLAVGLIFFIDSFQNPAMGRALSGRQDSSAPLNPLTLSQLAKNLFFFPPTCKLTPLSRRISLCSIFSL